MTPPEYPLPGEIDVLLSLLGPVRVRNCPLRLTARQEAFLHLSEREAFYGGAAGGGKSVALLAAALQYSDVPGYDALIVRPSLAELYLPGSLIELAHEWLADTKARWSADTKTWRFPGAGRSGAGGASLTFGYLADASDLARYQGTSFSFLGFDELTRFDEAHYRRMFRVLRQPLAGTGVASARDGTTLAEVPVRIRSTSNPGGPGHAWVRERFVNPETRHPGAVYLPSRVADNPHLDIESYLATLTELPTAERHRLMHGDWEIPDDGELFRREWFLLIEAHQVPESGLQSVRSWDLAATEPNAANRDPDWTVGLRLSWHRQSGDYFISDIVRERRGPGAVEELVRETARRDGVDVSVIIEQEPGAAGAQVVDHYKRHVLSGYTVKPNKVTGDKRTRATPVAATAEGGLIKLVRGRHTSAFLDELTAFPHGRHDDCVDALSAAFTSIPRHHGMAIFSVPRRQRVAHPLEAALRRSGVAHYLSGEELAARFGGPYYSSETSLRPQLRR